MAYEDWEDEEWVEDDAEESDDVLACPACGGVVHQDTQQCPHCGDWITPVDPREGTKRVVVAVVVVLLILSLVLVTIF